ncbi:MAG: hypothetical protein RIT51_738 [Actinomycetota bacterium]|jgi:DNA-binding NarL/FixJ family response regulator
MNFGLRLAILDADDYVREGRALLFSSQPDFQVVYESGDPTLALEQLPEYLVDVILLDLRIPGWDAPGYIANLSGRLVDAGSGASIVATTNFAFSNQELAVFQAGALDYVAINEGTGKLLKALRQAATRETAVPAERLRGLIKESIGVPKPALTVAYAQLEQNQLNVVSAMLEGKSDTQIAKEFDLTRYRVSKFLDSLTVTAGYRTRSQLALDLMRLVSDEG